MTEEEKKNVDRVRPWAAPLRAMRHAMGMPELSSVPLGDILRQVCKHYKVDYPPADIEFTILKLAAGWAMQGVPVPVEEGV